MQALFKSFDMFGASVPSLNIRGERVIKTSAGACVSIIVIGLTTLFALLKLQFMLARSQPAVVKSVENNFFDTSERYNLADEDFMFAVSLEHYKEGIKMNPRYVKWVASLITSTPDSYEEIYMPMS